MYELRITSYAQWVGKSDSRQIGTIIAFTFGNKMSVFTQFRLNWFEDEAH